jgi:Yip1-like protein
MKALIARVKNLLLSPGSEWDVIDTETDGPRRLALGYVTPLATLPVIATIIGLAIVGVEIGGAFYRAPAVGVVLSSLLFFALTILGVFLFALIVNWLAPRFGGQASYRQAFKVAAYSITAAMLAGVLTAFPALGILALLGATYSLYLLFVGAPKVMHVTGMAAVNYSIVTTFIALLLGLGVGLAAMSVSASNGAILPSLAQLRGASVDPTNPVPAGASLNLGPAPLPDAAGVLAETAPATPTGGDLRGATPLKIATLERVAVSAERRGLAGARTVEVEAEYRNNNRYLVLQIIYSPTIATAIGFGGPATSEYDRETADGYSRRRRVGEAVVVEDWNNASRTGSYGRLVDDKFYVKASGGGGVLPADLRAAVELFGRQTLAQMEAES